MDLKEFDKFAEEYENLHQQNIKISGEKPEFFCEYKIKDLKQLAQQNGLPENAQILDFGCGVGNSLGMMNKYFPQSSIHGIDVSEKSIEIARQRFGDKAHIQTYDGTKLPYADNQFDIVFAACVFHHIPQEYYAGIFQEIKRVLQPNGIFVIFEHNPLNPLTVQAVNTCPFDENAVLITNRQLSGMLKNGIFNQTNSAYRIFFPNFLSQLRFLEKYLTWLPLGAQYYVVSKK